MSDLVKYQAPDVMTLGATLAKSGYFQDARDAAQAVVKILAGQELGFGPVASMTGIYIVKGKVSLSANLIAAAVKRGKYNYRVMELSETACKIDFYEGKEKVGESAFTMEDAKVAGLASSENYKKFARNMLFARAMSNGAKWYCADVFGGPVYTPDELGAMVDGETGEMTERPKDEKIAPAILESPGSVMEQRVKETTDQQAARLFPTDEEQEQRVSLIASIKVLAAQKKLTTKQRQEMAGKYLNTGDLETADVAALHDLEAALAAL
jgi:hypothetical protein